MGRSASASPASRSHPGRPAVDGPRATGSARGSRGCAAPRSGSRSVRCPQAAPSCRRSCPTSPRSGSRSTPRGVRQGRDRRCRRPGSRQQRLGRRHSRADAVARPAHQRHRGGDADRVRVLRNPARPNAVREGTAADLDADRQPVHRQLPAAGAQPAAGAAVGQAAAHPAALPVRGHPVLRDARCARGERAATGPGAAAGIRPARPDDAHGSGCRCCR